MAKAPKPTAPAKHEIVYRRLAELQQDPKNARIHPPEQIERIRASIREFGFNAPLLLKDDETTVGAGNGRLEAALLEGLEEGPTITLRGLSEAKWRAYAIADNRAAEGAEWNLDVLRIELTDLASLPDLDFDLSAVGFDLSVIEDLGLPGGSGNTNKGSGNGALKDRFGIVPFSVLNAREGWWQDRKNAWLALGIRSEVGRGENLLKMSDTVLEPDPEKRKANKARFMGEDLLYGEGKLKPAKGGKPGTPAGWKEQGKGAVPETAGLKGGLTFGITTQPYSTQGERRNANAKLAGSLYTETTPAKDPQFYAKKRKAEEALGRELSLEEFRERFYQASDTPVGAGTSIFDPVLCELAYRWWCPPSGMILDPFAGGSVRGIVAAKLGRSYTGIDLRLEQIEANRVQGAELLGPEDGSASWIEGDSLQIAELAPDLEADFLFSCPPYADLERYSDDPRDLSTMDYAGFVEIYREIIGRAAAKLRPDRFACFVVGDVRGPDGNYRGFVPDTIQAFEAAGLRFYNEAILVTAAGSLPMRAGRAFETTRKLGKTHQNVLVFLKGSAKKAVQAIGAVEFAAFDPAAGEESTAGGESGQANPPPAGDEKYGELLTALDE